VTYTYDNSHHVTSRTDATGRQTQYTYDSYGRVTEVQYYPYSGYEDPTQRVVYYYDAIPPNSFPLPGALRCPTALFKTPRGAWPR